MLYVAQLKIIICKGKLTWGLYLLLKPVIIFGVLCNLEWRCCFFDQQMGVQL
uniref:Uncharacterized protein n=1 Tax=Rhizophora mucronata TaxID=61149 RepID=A0A2P2IMF4_RHIMU